MKKVLLILSVIILTALLVGSAVFISHNIRTSSEKNVLLGKVASLKDTVESLQDRDRIIDFNKVAANHSAVNPLPVSSQVASDFDKRQLKDVAKYIVSGLIKGSLLSDNKNISVVNFGDAMFDRQIKAMINDGTDPFEQIRGIRGIFLKSYDLAILNLEGPISEQMNCQKKKYSFKFNTDLGKLLRENSIDYVNLANNHSFDCYQGGVNDTLNNLERFAVGSFGQSNLGKSYQVVNIKDKNIVLLGIDQTLQPVSMAAYYPLVEELKETNDYVVVYIHWGTEYAPAATAAQVAVAHKLIDSGVDVIIGHHPHVIEPVEIYRNKAIFYSLGNFIFDQMMPAARQGVGVGFEINDQGFNYEIMPYDIINNQPTFFTAEKSLLFCDEFLKDIEGSNNCSFKLH